MLCVFIIGEITRESNESKLTEYWHLVITSRVMDNWSCCLSTIRRLRPKLVIWKAIKHKLHVTVFANFLYLKGMPLTTYVINH